MRLLATKINNCLVVEMPRHLDDRGFFQELYSHRWAYSMPMWLSAVGYTDWKQANWSSSQPGVIRGLHCASYPKLVTCIAGHVFDVVVDLREDSITYKQWFGIDLKAGEPRSLLIPAGCAHGFAALESSTVIYLTGDVYGMDKEWTVRWNDPEIAVEWPIKVPNLSEKDSQAKTLAEIIQERSRRIGPSCGRAGT